MPFGEYELSPSLIGLSLLHTPHPEAFQRLLVGTSIRCYPDFILDMCRSLGFASAAVNSAHNVRFVSRGDNLALFRLAFTADAGIIALILACDGNSQAHYAKGTPSPPARLRPLVGGWFQDLFQPSHRSAFHLSLTVLVHCRSHSSI